VGSPSECLFGLKAGRPDSVPAKLFLALRDPKENGLESFEVKLAGLWLGALLL